MSDIKELIHALLVSFTGLLPFLAVMIWLGIQPMTLTGIVTGIDERESWGTCEYIIVFSDSNKLYTHCEEDVSRIIIGSRCSVTIGGWGAKIQKAECDLDKVK